MSEGEKLRAIELIERIQRNGGTREDLYELEQATGNANFWYAFDELELEGLLPEKILELFCGSYVPNPTNAHVLNPGPRNVSRN